MKNVTILRFLTAIGSAVSTVAALDLAGIANVLDPATAKYLLAAGPAALALKELVVVLGDWFDDGKPNKSFKFGIMAFTLMAITTVCLSACSAPPPFSGTFSNKNGQIKVYPDGHFELIVEPNPSK